MTAATSLVLSKMIAQNKLKKNTILLHYETRSKRKSPINNGTDNKQYIYNKTIDFEPAAKV